MKRLLLGIVMVALCAGCATTAPKKHQLQSGRRPPTAGNVAQAVELLRTGDSAGATRILNEVVLAPPVPGVTDEALFRLALITLKPSPERPASRQGRLLLKRLRREFPASPWTAQAAPLVQLIGAADQLRRESRTRQRSGSESTDELKRQNQALKATNDSLTREINELNQNLEKLKRLDLELEQKNR